MILLDTTVVIDWSQSKDAKLRVLMPSLPAAVCGATQAEFLHGSRDPAHRQKLLTELATFQFVPMPDALWITVGDNLAALRSNGVTVPFADAVIATLGIENGIEIWARRPALSGNAKDPPSAQALPGTAVSNAEGPPGRPISPNQRTRHGTRRLSFVSSSFCNGAPTALPPAESRFIAELGARLRS